MDTIITLDAMVVSLLVGTLLPILVGLVTKLNVSGGVKAVLLLTLSVVQGAVVNATQVDGSAVFSKETLLLAGVGWVTAIASYYGLLKPTNISPKVNEKTAKFGVGSG